MKKVYRVRYEKDESGWWIVTAPEVAGCRTQGRSLGEGRKRIREALALFIGERAAAKATFVDDVLLPDGTRSLVRKVAAERTRLEEVQAATMKATADAARLLTRKAGLSVRDAAELLGVSHQRIQQLAGARR